MFSATRSWEVVEGTLQGTEVERRGQREEQWLVGWWLVVSPDLGTTSEPGTSN